VNREAKRESGESAESEDALSSDPLGRNGGQQLSSGRTVMDPGCIGRGVGEALALKYTRAALSIALGTTFAFRIHHPMESHFVHAVQATPGIYVATALVALFSSF